MYRDMIPVRCSIMRGGTSKAVFFSENDLPTNRELRDKVILAAFGSPDVRQIDGLGGADPLTSKVAIIGPSTRKDCDVDYTFGQVSFQTAFVDYKGNCGNISSAVGPFAIDAGLVRPVEPFTTIRVHLTNTDNVIIARVPVRDGRAVVDGDYQIDGVPGTGAKITLDFHDTQGSVTGNLLPTGNAKDVITVDGKGYTVSLVDVGNPLVFVEASSLGLIGSEMPDEIENNTTLMDTIEKIRGEAAVLLGLVERPEYAAKKSPYIPFFAIVSRPVTYTCYNGFEVQKENIDITARLLFMLKVHKTYPGTGSVCTGAAVKIMGTVPWDLLENGAKKAEMVRIGHPAGIMYVEAAAKNEKGRVLVTRAAFNRTARKIMDGVVYIKDSVMDMEA